MNRLKNVVPAVTVALVVSATALAGSHDKTSAKNSVQANNAPTLSLFDPYLLSLFDPYLLGVGGSMFSESMPDGGKGMPVYDAKDLKKIIGYARMPTAPKRGGHVLCAIKGKGLLAQSVDDCEAVGGKVAKIAK